MRKWLHMPRLGRAGLLAVFVLAVAGLAIVPGHRGGASSLPARAKLAGWNTNGNAIVDGSKISVTVSQATPTCTAGWWAVDANDNNYLLTAGHCLESSTAQWSNSNGYQIGQEVNWDLAGASPSGPISDKTDWGVIGITNGDVRPTTQVSVPNGTDKIEAVSGAWPYTPVGGTVCFTGEASSQQCGPVISYNVTENLTDPPEGGAQLKLQGLAAAGICEQNGDDGAPVYQVDSSNPGYVIPQGILVTGTGSGTGCVTYYTPIQTALNDSDLTIISSVGAPTITDGTGIPPGQPALKFGTSGHCLDSNQAGSVYVDGCNRGAYQEWGWANGENGDGTPSTSGAGPLLDQQTGNCLDSNAQGDVYTGPCDGGNSQNWTDNNGLLTNAQTGLSLQIEGPGAPGDPDSVNAVPSGSNPPSWKSWQAKDSKADGSQPS